ncbi:MAG: IS200/IS605 family transposase [Moorea sp. SIO1G6]|uniref:IS200/IS605 family transposase n=1 Tax=Moorena producens (strain JHB) TaxID=1454205 RepID=A0A1D9G799_MOOP1|nr:MULTISPECIES: IS200/IS605 family transposase [Moorena]AOY83404.2 IS200/IS605 family transposase [Moorena producens JHB]NEQ10454.1 IS200/IS605 family transposase [Moorena sp. SIO4E2]NES85919.1 IS200/IS605 family transposase [Moorena sp. SIO2B7]NET68307.1 IS200/IS605 family transposase [Moorena sp. SIO1G6]
MKNSFGYRHYNHAVGICTVHLVWIPKRRKKVLVGKIRDRIYEIFAEIALDKNWNIKALEVAPDQIHLFVEINPTDAIYQVVRAFKGRSANYLRKEFPDLKKLPSLWTNSYFFSTAGKVSIETIQRYINDPHHG